MKYKSSVKLQLRSHAWLKYHDMDIDKSEMKGTAAQERQRLYANKSDKWSSNYSGMISCD